MSASARSHKPKDSRQQQRFSIECQVHIKRSEFSHATAVMRNLSMGGALLEFSQDPQLGVGEGVELNFVIPNLDDLLGADEPMNMTAEVRWMTHRDDKFAVGLQFMRGFRAKQVLALQQLFRQLHKLAAQDP